MSLPYRWMSQLVRRGWLKVLSRVELVVLLILGDFVDHRSGETFVGADRIAEFGGLAPSSVYEALGRLRKRGLLRSERREREGRYRRYTVEVHTLIPLEDMPSAETTPHKSGEYYDTPEMRNEEHSETTDRDRPYENEETPRPQRDPDTLSDQVVQERKADQDQLSNQGKERSVNAEHPLARLGQLLEDIYIRQPERPPNEIIVTALIDAGRSYGWTERDVRMAIAAVWARPGVASRMRRIANAVLATEPLCGSVI